MGFLIDYLLNGFGVDIAHLLMCLPVRVLWVVLVNLNTEINT